MVEYYAIYDDSLKLSNPPFIARNENDAIRIVRDFLLSSSSEILVKVSSCCSLVYVATFHEDKAIFTSPEECIKICDLSDIPLPGISVDSGGDS